jgi:photosystem II stability/assembly factor-like uncharacterized protein
MKNKAFLVLFLIVFCCAGVALSNDSESQIKPYDKIFAVHFRDDNIGWAVGAKGLMLNTVDGGTSWRRAKRITKNALNDITFIDDEGWIVGQDGIILHSVDRGKQWDRQESNWDHSLMGVFFSNRQTGFAIGERGKILSTKDGGRSWEQYPLDWMTVLPENVIRIGVLFINLYDIFFLDGVHGWIVGEKGAVLYSSDGGRQWELLRVGEENPILYSVYFRNKFEGFAVGQDGYFLHTQDGGKSWDRLRLPAEISKLSLFEISMEGSFGVVVGDRGLVLKSMDGGESWEQVALKLRPPLPWFLDVSILPGNLPNEVILVGHGLTKKILLKKGG